MNQKPVWKLDDAELLAEMKRRGSDAKVLNALTKVQRMLCITAERDAALAPGLKVAVALIGTFAMQFGGETSESATHALLRDVKAAPKPPVVKTAPAAPLVRRVKGENVSAKMRAFVASTSGDITIRALQRAFPAANKAIPYRVTKDLVTKGVLVKVGDVYRRAA